MGKFLSGVAFLGAFVLAGSVSAIAQEEPGVVKPVEPPPVTSPQKNGVYITEERIDKIPNAEDLRKKMIALLQQQINNESMKQAPDYKYKAKLEKLLKAATLGVGPSLLLKMWGEDKEVVTVMMPARKFTNKTVMFNNAVKTADLQGLANKAAEATKDIDDLATLAKGESLTVQAMKKSEVPGLVGELERQVGVLEKQIEKQNELIETLRAVVLRQTFGKVAERIAAETCEKGGGQSGDTTPGKKDAPQNGEAKK